MKPPRAMRFILAMLLCYAFPPVFTLSILDSAFEAAGSAANWTNPFRGDDGSRGWTNSSGADGVVRLLPNLHIPTGENRNNSLLTLEEGVLDTVRTEPAVVDSVSTRSRFDDHGGANLGMAEKSPLTLTNPTARSKWRKKQEPQCVMRGQCNFDEARNTYQNCEYAGPPKQLADSRAKAIARKLCPQLFSEFGESTELCCDEAQLFSLEKNLGVPQQFFSRCPSCFNNFANLWCQSTCSPVQSNFLEIVKVSSNGHLPRLSDPSIANYVTHLRYYLSDEFASGLFDSCKRVQYPGSNQRAIEMMCGAAGAECNIHSWLHFMGDIGVNDMSPFQIDFIVSNQTSVNSEPFSVLLPSGGGGDVIEIGGSYDYNDDYDGGISGEKPKQPGSTQSIAIDHDPSAMFEPLVRKIVPCSSSPSADALPCSCQDCEASCAARVPYPDTRRVAQCHVGRVDCVVFVSLVAFGVLCVVTLATAAFHCFLWKTSDNLSSPFKYPSSPLQTLKNEGMDIGLFDEPNAPGIVEMEPSRWHRWGAWIEARMESSANQWGVFCTRHPMVICTSGFLICLLASTGVYFVNVTTDPVKLWSSPHSQGRQDKDFFDKHFQPFYRTEQLIIVPKNQTSLFMENRKTGNKVQWGPVFQKEFLSKVLRFQEQLMNLTVEDSLGGPDVTLTDICYKPLEPDNNQCSVFSVLQYFQNQHDHLEKEFRRFGFLVEDYADHLQSCFEGPTQVSTGEIKLSCLSIFGAPVFPYIVLGGFNDTDYGNATALVITVVVNNHVETDGNAKAEAWETALIEFVQSYEDPEIDVFFKAERSIQDEINRESKSDMSTIVISYSVMFFYIAFALGQYSIKGRNPCYLLVNSKFTLGFAGVLIVLMSVMASVGVYSYFGIPATLIIIEVVPFLVLAVGVDNIFILVQAYQRDKHGSCQPLENRIGRICGEVIPSMLISSSSECVCFFLGALSTMPAVKIFSLYAAMAIFFDFFLQITCFLALFTMDIRRQEAGRLECCCFVQLEPVKSEGNDAGILHGIMSNLFAPLLLTRPVRLGIFLIFSAWVFTSIAVVNKVEIGLDQKLAMPEDSYVLRYFEAMEKYLEVGAPVYFVVDGEFDYSDPNLQNAVCGSSGCRQESLYGQIYNAAAFSDLSYIAHPVTSWLDDYFDWLRPIGNPACCRLWDADNATFCPSTETDISCHSCDVRFEAGRPVRNSFYEHVDDFLIDNPGFKCSKGGHAAYGNALSFSNDHKTIKASYFMTYHTILRTSQDYINALKNARFIAENITKSINAELPEGHAPVRVFAYSIFYVFYEQYLSIVHDAVMQLILSLSAIFAMTTVFLGLDPWSAAMIVITIGMILIDMCGLMFWWGISFNAVSLVNLVMATGIAVEFCAHIVRANSTSIAPTRVERAKDALSNMGSSVLSGITLTKFGGILVLAFSHSQIFQIFYFRMYLAIVLIGAAHSLLFLPVLLSFIGPPVNRCRLYKLARRDMGMDVSVQGDHQQLRSGPPSTDYLCRLDSFEREAGSVGYVNSPHCPLTGGEDVEIRK